MIQLAEKYPEYGFESHVGYGTAAHQQALLMHGVCPEHRRSFRPIREIIESQNSSEPSQTSDYACPENTSHALPRKYASTKTSNTASGQAAEQLVITYLESQNHTIIAHNYKAKTYEIDIISTLGDKIFFTEVKSRRDHKHGAALNQITPQKLDQITYATEAFLASHPDYRHLQPLLAAASVTKGKFTADNWFIIR